MLHLRFLASRTRSVSRLAALCGLTVLGCARSSESTAESTAAPFVPPSGIAARVYVAVLDSLARDSSSGPIVVPESTVVFRAPAGVPTTWDEFALVPPGLPARLESLSGAPQASARLPLPRPVRVLTAAESEAIRVAQPRDWWGEFRHRNPGQRQVLSFSPIAFTSDSTTALVEFVQGCGEKLRWRIPRMAGAEEWRSLDDPSDVSALVQLSAR